MNYKPLPSFLTIKSSEIEGLGLFATEDIPKDINLGESHIENEDELIRTPLGGFYNHSNTPNCIKNCNSVWPINIYSLITLRAIKAGEEITVKYTFYFIPTKIIKDGKIT